MESKAFSKSMDTSSEVKDWHLPCWIIFKVHLMVSTIDLPGINPVWSIEI